MGFKWPYSSTVEAGPHDLDAVVEAYRIGGEVESIFNLDKGFPWQSKVILLVGFKSVDATMLNSRFFRQHRDLAVVFVSELASWRANTDMRRALILPEITI